MPKKSYTPEQIVTKLREIDVLTAQGHKAGAACKQAGISEQSYYRWRKEYGGLGINEARRLKELERENSKLKRCIAELAMEKQVLKALPRENSKPREKAAGGRARSEIRPFGTA